MDGQSVCLVCARVPGSRDLDDDSPNSLDKGPETDSDTGQVSDLEESSDSKREESQRAASQQDTSRRTGHEDASDDEFSLVDGAEPAQ